ncbi:MAG: hypothetical protein JNL52_03315 [Flavobacteriales bacterium]|nr:hypothetical protein [Flavobacteriales bacterium]
MRLPLLLSLLSLTIGTRCMATRYHVNVAATGAGTGLSWANAFTDLQEALSVVVPGDEIWVAAGQYKPTSGTTRTISFQVRNGVNMFGGFAGTETSLNERDIAANPTVLNGNIGEPGNSTDNSHSVVTANLLTIPTVLDGFRIMNGYSGSGSGYNGGGMRVTNTLAGRLTVRNCTLVNNYSGTYGGGIYLGTAKLALENCDLINNSAGTGGDGGAILNGNNNGGESSVLIIRDSRFTNNTARRGACLFNTIGYDTLLIERSIFTNNTSEISILTFDGFNEARVLNSFIIGNTVNGSSNNVLYVNASSQTDRFSMINCTVAHNYNVYSGSLQEEIIKVFDTQHVIQNSIIHGNTAYNGRQASTNIAITSSIVQGGHSNGTDIIDLDPQFAAPYTGTPTNFDASAYDYHPMASSPAINAGNNDLVAATSLFDLDGEERIQGGVVDLGCYESDLTVGMAERPTEQGAWYFDADQGMLHVGDLGLSGAVPVEVLTLSGQLVARITVQQGATRLELPAGMYVARAEGLRPLRFVVAR